MNRTIHFENSNFTFVIAFSSNYFRSLSKFLLEYHMSWNLIHSLVSSHIFLQSLVSLNLNFGKTFPLVLEHPKMDQNAFFGPKLDPRLGYLPLFPDPFCRRPRFFGFAGRAVFVPLSEDKYPDCRGIILTDGIVVGFCIDCMNALKSIIVTFYIIVRNSNF